MAFAEIHFHLLPGVDDGPPSMDASVELARLAAAEGTRTIVATPHVSSFHATDVAGLPERVRELAVRLRRERVPIGVLCGGELSVEMVGRLSLRDLEAIAQGPPENRWLLLEAPFSGLDDGFAAAADELRRCGYAVVVAHPERSLGTFEYGWRVLERELRAGSGVQLTAWSLAGLFGELARRHAMTLLRAAPLAAISSDAHGAHRAPALRLALDALRRLGEQDAHRFAGGIPRGWLESGLPKRSSALAA